MKKSVIQNPTSSHSSDPAMGSAASRRACPPADGHLIKKTFQEPPERKTAATAARRGAVGVDFRAEGEARSLDLYKEHMREKGTKSLGKQKHRQYLEVCTLEGLHPQITEKRSSGNGWYISTRKFPTGDVEAFGMQLTHEDSLHRGGGGKRTHSEKSEMDEVTLKKSQQRTRRVVRHRCLTLMADRLLTLTFKENLEDIDKAWKVFKYFNKLMRWKYGERYKYIAVPEYQKRGAVHFHLAISGFYPVNTVRKLWRRAAGIHGGNIDITSPKRAIGKNSFNPKRIANYLSKYITKGDSVSFNRARYSSGGRIDIPEPLRGWVALGLPTTGLLVSIVEKLTHKPIRTVWEPDGWENLIFITT